jgi:hypothetical protein
MVALKRILGGYRTQTLYEIIEEIPQLREAIQNGLLARARALMAAGGAE